MKGICLCSGGLDSTLALVKLLEQGHEVVPVFVDYNQWSLEGELSALNSLKGISLLNRYILDYFYTIMVDLNSDDLVSPGIGSVWGRGIALVGLAAMWAYTHGDDYDFIALGNHRGDVGPDCKPTNMEELDPVVRLMTKGRIEIWQPIRDLQIEDIGMQLKDYGVPFDILCSCYWGPPCGYKSVKEEYRCPGCRRKVLAMKAAGITDEKLLNFPNGRERTYQSGKAEEVGY